MKFDVSDFLLDLLLEEQYISYICFYVSKLKTDVHGVHQGGDSPQKFENYDVIIASKATIGCTTQQQSTA